MDSTFNHIYLEELLRTHKGLINVNCKMPVKDRNALALVYTPGVGACCKLIEKDHNRAYDLTNKRNAILVITDASLFIKEGSTQLNSQIAFPYIEAICVYYKTVANVDAYPIIIDFNQIKTDEDFQSVVKAITPAFSFVEFFGVRDERVKDFCSDGKFAFVNSNIKIKLDQESSINFVNSNLIYSGVIRAALDIQAYHNLNECVEYVVKYLSNKYKDVTTLNTSLNPLDLLPEIVFESANFLLNKNNITNISAQKIKTKTINFLILGKLAWVEQYPNNYFSKQHSINENSILLHRRYLGVVETGTVIDIKNIQSLNQLFKWDNLDYISNIILKDPEEVSNLTCKGNLGAIITNGTAILGYGDIGALAGLPVMEGKCILFKLFGGTNVVPLCIQEKNSDKLISIINKISLSFSAINLEDIKAPECFKVESELGKMISYPVFHDDQHGTAIVVLAGIINACKLAKKKIEDIKIVMNGAGAAGLSVTELLVTYGAKNIIICDTTGAIYNDRETNMNSFKRKLAKLTNPNKQSGNLKEVLKNSDIFIGVSAPKTLTQEMIKTMNVNPIIFALANPEPEIYPDEAIQAGALIVATGRSDFNNQVNNSLAFPGIFRAVIDTRAERISIQMKIAASIAIANIIPVANLNPNYIIPDCLDSRVPVVVALAVAREALESKLARNKNITVDMVEQNILSWISENNLNNWDMIMSKNLEFKNFDLKPKF